MLFGAVLRPLGLIETSYRKNTEMSTLLKSFYTLNIFGLKRNNSWTSELLPWREKVVIFRRTKLLDLVLFYLRKLEF